MLQALDEQRTSLRLQGDIDWVMQQIVDTSGEPGLTREVLYGRWWDYMNESPGVFPEARHCDDPIGEILGRAHRIDVPDDLSTLQDRRPGDGPEAR